MTPLDPDAFSRRAPAAAVAEWRPSGVVALVTDFGLEDGYVGALKGVLLRAHPAARPVDVTHGVPAQDVAAGAFHLRHAWRHFAPGTVHVAVVDPGVGSGREILLARSDDHAFLAPDNGLLPAALGEALTKDCQVRRLDTTRLAAHARLGPVSATFHGRDLFAPAAAALASGVAPEEISSPLAGTVEPAPARAAICDRDEGDAVDARVLHVDRFGNLITSWAPRISGAFDVREWAAKVGGRRIPGAATYADVAQGEPLALIDSFGHVELAVRDGDAARALGLGRGDTVRFEQQS